MGDDVRDDRRHRVEIWTARSDVDRMALWSIPVQNPVEGACIASYSALQMFHDIADKVLAHDWNKMFESHNDYGEEVNISVESGGDETSQFSGLHLL